MSREVELSTGKKIVLREKKGQHHFIENKLLASCLAEGGQNIGGIMSAMTIKNIVAIESIDGDKINTPTNLGEIFELMDHFSYEEWAEFEKITLPKEAKEKLEELAKNSQVSTGSVTE